MSNVRQHVAIASLHEAVSHDVAALLPGWRFVKTVRSFRSTELGCTHYLHLSFVNHVADFDVIADVAVEHLHKRQRICIVGAELGNIAGTGQHRWHVSSTSEAWAAAAGIVQLFQEVGIPFLKRYSSLGEVLRVLREEPKEAQLICPLAQDPVAEALCIEARAPSHVA
jgi:hypothetical protein